MALLRKYKGQSPRTETGGSAWLAENCSLVGDVVLGASVSVWYGAVVRGDDEPIEIGPGSNIQDNAVLHVDPGFPIKIGANVSVGHGAILHGCSIGSGSVVGMGAIVMNGAEIGRDCLIAAGTVVLEGMKIPDGALVVGSPGKVKRHLSFESRSGLRDGASRYQEKATTLLEPFNG